MLVCRDSSGDDASSSSSDDGTAVSGDDDWEERDGSKGPISKIDRKAHKALVKAANRERRKTKTPKKVKQKAKKSHRK